MLLEELIFDDEIERLEGYIPGDGDTFVNGERATNEWRWQRRYIIIHYKDGTTGTIIPDKHNPGEWTFPEERSYSDVIRD